MPQELIAALIGAAISGLLMVISNYTNKRHSRPNRAIPPHECSRTKPS
jgi:hypothetical protein